MIWRNRRIVSVLGCALALALTCWAPPLWAAGDQAPLSKTELRERLLPLYQRLQTDPQYQALVRQLDVDLENREVVDRYLAYLPLSPREMLELDMFTRRFEVPIPRLIQEWHWRWIALHPDAAEELYGAEVVERARAGGDLAAEDGAAGGLATRTGSPGPNRNLAYNFPISPDDYQGEIQVVVNPNDPDEIVAAANTWDNIPGTCATDTQAVFYSSDGGTTWGYTCSPGAAGYPSLTCPTSLVFGSDPALFWNDNNEVFINHMLICFYSGNYHFAIVVAKSTTGGATWSGQGVVINSWGNLNLEDKNFYAIDNHPGSPYYGRHYTCWDRNNNEKSAYSTNSGVTWTEVDLPPTPSSGSGGAFDLACELEVEDDGTVHVIYDTLRCTALCNNEQMFYSQSTNGGVSWSAPVEVRDFNLVGFSNANCPLAQNLRCINPFGAVGVDNSGGPCDGNLYASFTDWTSGGVNTSDVFVTRSTDGGATWQTPVKVNDDGGSNIQFHPFLQVDSSNGTVVVAWQDARNYTANHRIDFFAARSVDCGMSFETNVQASQPSTEFNNSTISWSNFYSGDNPGVNPNQTGEYMGLDVLDGNAYVAWCDTRHYFPMFTSEPQKENVGFSLVTFSSCDLGKASGRWNLPGPAIAGGAKGTLYDASSTPVYTIRVSLVQTSPGQGTMSGSLYQSGTPVFNVSGTWQITAPPGNGTFEAKFFPLTSSAPVGIINGRFSDDPLSSVSGLFGGVWQLCP